jgi:hypothetical protein
LLFVPTGGMLLDWCSYDERGLRPGLSLSVRKGSVAKSSQPWILTLVRTISDQPDAGAVRAQFDGVVTMSEAKFPPAAEHLGTTREDLAIYGPDGRERPSTLAGAAAET